MFGSLIEISDDYFASTLECVSNAKIFIRKDEHRLFKVRNDADYKLTNLLDAFNIDNRYRTLLDGDYEKTSVITIFTSL